MQAQRKDLKLGNVIEVRCGEKFIVGMSENAQKVLRSFNDEFVKFEFESYLDNAYNENLDVHERIGCDYDIVKVYEDIRCLIDKEIAPIWERNALYDLEFDTPIWVKNVNEGEFVIRLFKGVESNGKVLAWDGEGQNTPVVDWDCYKLFTK